MGRNFPASHNFNFEPFIRVSHAISDCLVAAPVPNPSLGRGVFREAVKENKETKLSLNQSKTIPYSVQDYFKINPVQYYF